jgi:predicted RNA-binding Zn-ribbon protein involved in translation (DUF1610 family)
MKTAHDFPTYLECPRCGEKSNEADVEIILIRDYTIPIILTFICPKCGKVVESHRYG